MQICEDQDVAIPEKIAVLGIDDTKMLCELATVLLSSFNFNIEQRGREAALLLDRLMNGERSPEAPIVIPPRGVIARQSTNTIAIPNADVAKLLAYLRRHFTEPMSLLELCRKCHQAPNTVHTVFIKYLGHSLRDELTKLRIQYAKKLLEATDLKLEAMCGYSSRVVFHRCFQRLEGCSPSAYRSKKTQ